MWSSDRRVGARRVPTQLLESATAAALGGLTLRVVTSLDIAVPGTVFAAALAAYTLVRQVLLPLRAEQRRSLARWQVTVAPAATVLLVDALLAAAAG